MDPPRDRGSAGRAFHILAKPTGAVCNNRPLSGVAGRTISDSVPHWSIVAGVKPPEGAPNVLIVLIDDAGSGQPGHLRRSDLHPEPAADRLTG